MLKGTAKLLFLTALVAAGAVGVFTYYQQVSSSYRIRQLEEEKRILQDMQRRLTAERRVAELLVTDQAQVGGVKTSTLLFVEYDRAGKPLPPRSFTVRGEHMHLDAMVIKFDHATVAAGDPFKGASLALFTRIYGDATPPEQGTPIDPPGQVPAVYRGADPKVTDFELKLWADFWKLAHDESARKERGVRAVMGQGVWEPVRPETLYTLTLEAAGGLNLAREPLKGIYREALKSGK